MVGLPNFYVRRHEMTSSHSALIAHQLAVGDQIQLDAVIENARPLAGRIYVLLTSEQGTSTRLEVDLRLSIRTPLLVFTPDRLTANIVRGTQRILDVEMRNDGEVAATNVRLDLPADNRLSLVSFSTDQTDTSDVSNRVIPAGGSGRFSLAVTVPSTESLGELSGRIAINTELTTFFLSYKFYITSIRNLNLTVRVEDEYTYFAEDTPLLAGALVRLTSPRTRYSETFYTPASGML